MTITDVALTDLIGSLLPSRDLRGAACRGYAGLVNFDPPLGSEPAEHELAQRTKVAQDYCAGCPVRWGCGQAADAKKEPGLWGGALRFEVSARRGLCARDRRYLAVPLIPEAEGESPYNVSTVDLQAGAS